eukprot:7379808-Prymnesium_polylepis.1
MLATQTTRSPSRNGTLATSRTCAMATLSSRAPHTVHPPYWHMCFVGEWGSIGQHIIGIRSCLHMPTSFGIQGLTHNHYIKVEHDKDVYYFALFGNELRLKNKIQEAVDATESRSETS